jgi:hypothetical protein
VGTPGNVQAADIHVHVLPPPTPGSPPQVQLSGLAVCGLSSIPRTAANHLADFVWVDVDVKFLCPTITTLPLTDPDNPGGTTITQAITAACNVGSVTGTITARSDPPPFPANNQTQQALVPSSCDALAGCGINVGFPAVNVSTLQNVCPDGALSLAFNAEQRLQTVDACYCNNHFHDPLTSTPPADNPIDCPKVKGKFNPQTAEASGASVCAFDYQKTGAGGDTLNRNGISTINFAIKDTLLGTCPIDDINLSQVTVCDGLKPKKIDLQTNAGETFVSGQFSESACVARLTNVQVGQTRNIYVEGEFNDGTRFRGFDDVTVVGQ